MLDGTGKHCMPFDAVYGTTTSEEDLPSGGKREQLATFVCTNIIASNMP